MVSLTKSKIKRSARFFLYYMKMIYRRGRRKQNSMTPPSALVDSRASVRPSERTLLPGHVREWATMEDFRGPELLCSVLLRILMHPYAPQKK